MNLKLKGWRTRIVASLVTLVGILELYDPGIWASLVKPEWRPYVTIGLGVLIFLLRQYTTTPPGKKDT